MGLMSRRALLRSAGAAAGAVGMIGTGELSAAANTPAHTFTLRGSQLRILGEAGRAARPGEQIAVTGRLHRVADGAVVGHLYSTATVLSHDVVADGSPARLEQHLLHLDDGTLAATGTVTVTGHGRFTVTGGSGRYAHARGTYTTVQCADSSGGGDALFTIDLH